MKRDRFPSNRILGSIVIHTPHLALARRVEEIANVEVAERGITSGVACVAGRRIAWVALSSLKGRQPCMPRCG